MGIINPQLFHPLNMAYLAVVLIFGLYFFKWAKGHVDPH